MLVDGLVVFNDSVKVRDGKRNTQQDQRTLPIFTKTTVLSTCLVVKVSNAKCNPLEKVPFR